jgi:hypothetical protein
MISHLHSIKYEIWKASFAVTKLLLSVGYWVHKFLLYLYPRLNT